MGIEQKGKQATGRDIHHKQLANLSNTESFFHLIERPPNHGTFGSGETTQGFHDVYHYYTYFFTNVMEYPELHFSHMHASSPLLRRFRSILTVYPSTPSPLQHITHFQGIVLHQQKHLIRLGSHYSFSSLPKKSPTRRQRTSQSPMASTSGCDLSNSARSQQS